MPIMPIDYEQLVESFVSFMLKLVISYYPSLANIGAELGSNINIAMSVVFVISIFTVLGFFGSSINSSHEE
jgi:hypothetical protein